MSLPSLVSLDRMTVRAPHLALGDFRLGLSKALCAAHIEHLVAIAFVPNPFGKETVNHIDCNRANAEATNLEWCTQKENLMHSQNLGRMQRNYWSGRRSPSASLADATARSIRDAYAQGGVSYAALAKRYGTNKRTVGRIISGETYV